MKFLTKIWPLSWVLNGVDDTVATLNFIRNKNSESAIIDNGDVDFDYDAHKKASFRLVINLVKAVLYFLLTWALISIIVIAVQGVGVAKSAKTFIDAVKDGTDPALVDSSFSETAGGAASLISHLRATPILYTAAGVPGIGEKASRLDDVLVIGENFLSKIKDVPGAASDLLGFNNGEDGVAYYLAFQNNAQIKSLGGTNAQSMLLNFKNGDFDMGDSINSWMFGHTEDMSYRSRQPPADMGKPDPNGHEQNFFESLYPLHTFRSVLSSTLYPDFQVDAQGIIDSYSKLGGKEEKAKNIRGVMTFDPTGLDYLMRGIDPIYIEKCGCTITNDGARNINAKDKTYDASWYLQSGAYLDAGRQTGKPQDDGVVGDWTDEVFSEAEKKILDRIKDVQHLNFLGFLDGITQIFHERRLLLSFTDEKVNQAILGDGILTNLNGTMPNDNISKVHTATYFNDVEPSKIDAFIDFDVHVDRNVCPLNMSTYYDFTVTQTPKPGSKKEANSVKYIHSGDTIRTDFYVYGPQGADFLGMKVVQKGTQSDLFKKGQDTNFGRYFARSRAYLSFETTNVHKFRYKLPGVDLRPIDMLTTPHMNPVTTSDNTWVSCDNESDSDYTTVAVGQQAQETSNDSPSQQQKQAPTSTQQPATSTSGSSTQKK
ncbi:MAG: DUF4012 domain-containing protein [Candidatus Ancillula sp.]|jgi:hypothetical protein|nr:DUF4012 domain-containing protein [Candidatus Ancillula sp.]